MPYIPEEDERELDTNLRIALVGFFIIAALLGALLAR